MRIEDVLREMRDPWNKSTDLELLKWADTIEDEMTSIRRYAEMVLKGPGTGMPDNREWYLEGVRQIQKMARLPEQEDKP